LPQRSSSALAAAHAAGAAALLLSEPGKPSRGSNDAKPGGSPGESHENTGKMRKNSEKQRGKLAENLRKRGKMHWNLVVG
jgi:hypothetical protein